MRVPFAFHCTERLASMSETERGWHCAKCDKEVIDLDRLGPIARRLAVWLPRDEPPCVKITPRRASPAWALVLALGAAVSGPTAAAAPAADVHVCSPRPAHDGTTVSLGGVGGRRFTLLHAVLPRALRQLVRATFSRPHGDGVAHIAEVEPWRRVTVHCDGAHWPRRVEITDGEAIVTDLPSYRDCTFTLRGETPTQQIDFRVGSTESEEE